MIPREEEKINDKTIKKYYYLKELKGHKDRVLSLIKLQSGWIATGSYDSIIRIWIPEANNYFKEIQEIGAVQCLLEFEPDKILSGTTENNICLRDIHSENDDDYIYNFIGHYLWVNCLIKCSDKYFASCSNDGDIRVWNFESTKCENTLQGHVGSVLALILLNDGKLCLGGADNTIKIWNWEENMCEISLEGHSNWVKCLCELKNGYILSGSDDKTIKMWDEDRIVEVLIGHGGSVRSICQINDNIFASASFDKTIKIWDIQKRSCIDTLNGHESYVIGIIYHQAKNCLISISNDKTIKVWKI